ncbi:MAG: hypothetical protein AABZ61_12040 [Bacteroidota bacterium]
MDRFIVVNIGILSYCLFVAAAGFVATVFFKLWQKRQSAFERDFKRKMKRKQGIRLTKC